MKNNILVLAVFVSVKAMGAVPSAFDFSPSRGEVKALAVGRPKALKVHVIGEGPTGQLVLKDGKLSGALKIRVRTLATGISLRDKHLKEKYLELEKYPEAILTLTDLPLSAALNSEKVDAQNTAKERFSGTLSLHGVTQPVSGQYSAKASADGAVKISAEFDIRLPDYKIAIPNYLGVVIAEDVHVEISAQPVAEKL